jgi:hypothetical protein
VDENENRRPGRVQGNKRRFVALGALVPESLAPVLRQRGLATSAILSEWAEIVGPAIARMSTPLEIRWPRRHENAAGPDGVAAGPPPAKSAPARRRQMAQLERAASVRKGTLVIACPGAFALDVQMASARIIEAANRRLGFGLIGSIEIRQVPRPAPRLRPSPPPEDRKAIADIESRLSNIADDDLRRALARLGAELGRRPTPG